MHDRVAVEGGVTVTAEPMRILIADDEPLVRVGLRSALEPHTDVRVVGEAENGPDALAAIARQKPDVVLLDIQMAGLNGFEVIDRLGDDSPLTILVTAYDEYALRAFDANAVDYLLKPFSAERVARALDRARALLGASRAGSAEERLREIVRDVLAREDRSAGRRIAVRLGSRVVLLDTDTIECITAADHYARIHIDLNTSHLARESLSNLETRLTQHAFVRVHRSVLVNVGRITEMRTMPSGKTRITLSSGRRVMTSEAGRRRVQSLIDSW